MGKITIKNLEFYGYHGYYEFEREHGQRFNVDVELFGDFTKGEKSDKIEDVVNYVEVYELVKNYMEGESFFFLEKLGKTIGDEIIKSQEKINLVTIEIKKPEIPVPCVCDYFSVKMESTREVISYISLGSNMGDKRKNIESAINQLKNRKNIEVLEVSSLYETPPWGLEDQDSFYNAVVKIKTNLKPLELLGGLQEIENNLFRERVIRWGPRTIDLDILLYGDESINNSRVVIPHENLVNRGFVLVPLLELDKEENILINNKKISVHLKVLDTTDILKLSF